MTGVGQVVADHSGSPPTGNASQGSNPAGPPATPETPATPPPAALATPGELRRRERAKAWYAKMKRQRDERKKAMATDQQQGASEGGQQKGGTPEPARPPDAAKVPGPPPAADHADATGGSRDGEAGGRDRDVHAAKDGVGGVAALPGGRQDAPGAGETPSRATVPHEPGKEGPTGKAAAPPAAQSVRRVRVGVRRKG